MPLKLKLASHEQIIVNGASMVNGSETSTLIISSFAEVLRGRDILQEHEATTPIRRLYLMVQLMMMDPPRSHELMQDYMSSSDRIRATLVNKEDIEHLIEANRQVCAGDLYKALRQLRHLIAFDDRSSAIPSIQDGHMQLEAHIP